MLDDSDLIYRQIEATAKLHEPAVYQLLSFYHSLETQAEPLDGQFIPLTTVQLGEPSKTKIFAIGLIPPSVSGGASRLLDRSGTIRADGAYVDLIAGTPDVGSSSTGDLPGETSGLPTSMPLPVGPTQTDSTDFFDQYVAMCNRLGCQPEELAKVIQSECGWKEHATNSIAKGLIQLVKTTACGRVDPKTGQRVGGLGMSEADYAKFEQCSRLEQLPWIEKFYKKRAKGKNAGELKLITFGGYNNPDGSIWSSTAQPKPPENKPFRNAEGQRKAYELNKGVDDTPAFPGGPVPKGYLTVKDLAYQIDKHPVNASVLEGIKRAKERLGMGSPPPLMCEPDAPTTEKWPEKGAKDAQVAAKTTVQTAGKDLNTTSLGLMLNSAQQVSIRLMKEAVEQIAATPPLRMLVNPQSLRVSSEKLIASGGWGRNGPIAEHWGDQPDKIEGSGKIAAFYSRTAGYDTPGLSRTNRQFSTSYQNFLSLFLIYKNNGGVWLPDPLLPEHSRVHNLSVVGSVYLYYDGILYIGSFDSLSVNETDDAPFSLDYSFSFTVRASYLFDRADDPNTYVTAPTITASATSTNNAPITTSLPTTSTIAPPLQGGNNPQPSPEVAPPAGVDIDKVKNEAFRATLSEDRQIAWDAYTSGAFKFETMSKKEADEFEAEMESFRPGRR
jgi:hypothetical protein